MRNLIHPDRGRSALQWEIHTYKLSDSCQAGRSNTTWVNLLPFILLRKKIQKSINNILPLHFRCLQFFPFSFTIAVMLTSPPQLAKDQGDVLGTGTGHLLSSQHLDGRHNWFSHHHQQYMKYLPSEEPPFRWNNSFKNRHIRILRKS